MSKFRELAKLYRSNLKLTPNDKEPLELWIPEATTRTITKEYKLEDQFQLNTPAFRDFLEMRNILEMELEIALNGEPAPELNYVSFEGEVRI